MEQEERMQVVIDSFKELGIEHTKTEGNIVYLLGPKGKRVEVDFDKEKTYIFDEIYTHIKTVDEIDEEVLDLILN